MAFAVTIAARLLLFPPKGGGAHDAAGFASRYGPLSRSPNRAFDAGLRPGPLPDRAASLLPGLLTATRTGLTPAGDDELMLDQVNSNQPPPTLGAHCLAPEGEVRGRGADGARSLLLSLLALRAQTRARADPAYSPLLP